ncbi:O-antigen ligase family protein [Patescibacteria group bacterium]|nr:O-antigen ligase family protein [Patescibacteria group bacterium]
MEMSKLLFFLALYLPFQIALNPSEGFDVASIRVIIIGLFLVWLADGLKKKKIIFQKNIQTLLISSFLFLSLFSLFFSANSEWSIRKILFFFSIFPIYFVAAGILNSKEKILKTAKYLVLGGSLAALLGIIQFFSQFVFGLKAVYGFWADYLAVPFLGQTFSQAVLQNPSWLVNISGVTYFRATATFPDPHMFSFFLGLLIPLALALLIANPKKIWPSLALGLLLLADMLTFSRGGYLGLGVVLIAIPIFFWKEVNQRYKKIIFGGLVGLLIFLAIPNPFSGRFLSIFNLQEGSNLGRIETWKQAIDVITEHPIWGVGLGNYPLEIKPTATYREPIYAHNTYLDIAVDSGIVNALIWMGLLIFSIIKFFQRAKEHPIFWGAGLSLIIFFVHSLVETAIFSPVVLTLFLVILSFVNCPKTLDEKRN